MRTLKEQLSQLTQVQELDLKIDGLLSRKRLLPQQLSQIEAKLKAIDIEVAEKKNSILLIEKTSKQAHAALELNQERAQRSNQKLEGVQNSQEFAAANREIEQLKKFAAGLNEQIEKAKTDVAALEAQLVAIEEKAKTLRAEQEEKLAEVGTQAGELDAQLAKIRAERATYTNTIDKTTLARYDRVRQAKAGIGIAPAHSGRCTACHMMIPPQMFNQLITAKEFYSCPNCHRILFIPESK